MSLLSLPSDLIFLITAELESQTDLLNFSSSCKSLYFALSPSIWRSVQLDSNPLLPLFKAYNPENNDLPQTSSNIITMYQQCQYKLESTINEIWDEYASRENRKTPRFNSLVLSPSVFSSIPSFSKYTLENIQSLSFTLNSEMILDNETRSDPSSDNNNEFIVRMGSVLSPNVLPNLSRLLISNSCSYNSKAIDISAANQTLNQICQKYNNKRPYQNFHVRLSGWSLKSLLENASELHDLLCCLTSLQVPKVERDIPVTDLAVYDKDIKGGCGNNTAFPFGNLTELSLGHASKILMVENVIIQRNNFLSLCHFIPQLKGLRSLQLKGFVDFNEIVESQAVDDEIITKVDCLMSLLVPVGLSHLEVSQSALFPAVEYQDNRFTHSNLKPISSVSDITSLNLTLDAKLLELLPKVPEAIPTNRLKSLCIEVEHSDYGLEEGPLAEDSLLQFYHAMFAANSSTLKDLRINSSVIFSHLDKVFQVVSQTLTKLENLIVEPTPLIIPEGENNGNNVSHVIDCHVLSSKLDTGLSHLVNNKALQSLTIVIPAVCQLDLGSLKNMICRCDQLEKFVIVLSDDHPQYHQFYQQQQQQKLQGTRQIDGRSRKFSNLSAESSLLAPSNYFSSPATASTLTSVCGESIPGSVFSEPTGSSSNKQLYMNGLNSLSSQSLLDDLLLIEEGLQTINNFNFEDLDIDEEVDFDDLNINNNINFEIPMEHHNPWNLNADNNDNTNRQDNVDLLTDEVQQLFLEGSNPTDIREAELNANDNNKKGSFWDSFSTFEETKWFSIVDTFKQPISPSSSSIDHSQTNGYCYFTVIECNIPLIK